jgi:hypothetical protein
MGRSAAPLEVAGMAYWVLLWADPAAMSNSADRSSLPDPERVEVPSDDVGSL